MPTFLDADQVYRIIQRELPPDDVYPDGPAATFFSTADSYATAKVIGDAYASQQNIYENYFPNIAVDRLADFEFLYFGFTLDGALSVDQRRSRLLAKIRTRRRTTPDDIKAIVYTIIDSSILVEIVEWNNGGAGWMLDVSQLDVETILNEFNGQERTGPNLCQLGPSDYGLTPEEFARLQQQAYTYEIRIYSYTLTADQRTQMEQAVSAGEPARSQHIILDGLDPVDSIEGTN